MNFLKIVFGLLTVLQSVALPSQAVENKSIDLSGARVLRVATNDPNSGNDMMFDGSQKSALETVATVLATSGVKYSLAFPHGVGKKLIEAYLQAKKPFT